MVDYLKVLPKNIHQNIVEQLSLVGSYDLEIIDDYKKIELVFKGDHKVPQDIKQKMEAFYPNYELVEHS